MNTPSPQNAPSLPAGPARNNARIIRWALVAAAALVAVPLILMPLLLYGWGLGLTGLLVGIVLATLPVPLYLALALWLDRYEKEPIWMLVSAFLWGASVSFFFAVLFASLSRYIVGSAFGAGAGEFVAMVVSAPINEEASKGLALFILYWWKKDEFDNVMDGIIYAAMVGLGFAVAENYGYYGSGFVEGGIIGTLLVFVTRGVISPFLHPTFTAMTGIGLGLARQSNKTWVKFVAPVAGLLLAMLGHALWNGSTYIYSLLGNLQGLAGLVTILALIGLQTALFMIPVLAVVFFALRREGRTVRHYLTPELQSGLITQQEYDSLGSVSGRLASSFRALSSGGFGGWRSHARFSQAATELAFHRDRVSRGITSADAASREASYIQLLRGMKGQPQVG